jgi:hypothetical protein
VREWLYSLVQVDFFVVQKLFGQVARILDCDGRKKACLGHYKKSFFGSAKNAGFLQFLKSD